LLRVAALLRVTALLRIALLLVAALGRHGLRLFVLLAAARDDGDAEGDESGGGDTGQGAHRKRPPVESWYHNARGPQSLTAMVGVLALLTCVECKRGEPPA